MNAAMDKEAPRSVYVHVPFCRHRCGYCNFTLVASRDDLIAGYLEALSIELDRVQPHRDVDTIFLGGGTPTQLSADELHQLFRMLHKRFQLTDGGEWSCEANPLDCDDDKLKLLRDCGVNRLSIGGQSFDDKKLRVLERDHRRTDLERAIAKSLDYFNRVALDLIFAAPGETLADWEGDLEQGLACGVNHISTYCMTVERGSAFYGRMLHNVLKEVGEGEQLAMYEHTIDRAEIAGWDHYEVSSFTRYQEHCRHNQVYWRGDPWLAFGPGAAGFVNGVRSVNHRSTTQYIRLLKSGRSAIAEQEQLSELQRIRERLVFGLRQMQGVDLQELATYWTGDIESVFQPALDDYLQQGWLCRNDSRIALTRAGLMVSDSLWPRFLGEL